MTGDSVGMVPRLSDRMVCDSLIGPFIPFVGVDTRRRMI